MTAYEQVSFCLSQAGIADFGVCAFDSALLLPGVGSARRLPVKAKSVIVCLFPYYVGLPARRNLALYSMLPDYHTVAGAMLEQAAASLSTTFPQGIFVPFVDASPLDEVEAARRAGLGCVGQSGLLLSSRYGPLTLLGALVTDLRLEPDSPSGRCEGCGACLAACPTGALTANGLEQTLCRSALSQRKGDLSPSQAASLAAGGLAWGCDCCTLACPHASTVEETPIAAFLQDIEPLLDRDNLERLLQNRAFSWRGRAVLLRNLALLEQPR